MSWISSIFSRKPQIYGAPYEDKNGKIRIRIFQYIGGKRGQPFLLLDRRHLPGQGPCRLYSEEPKKWLR